MALSIVVCHCMPFGYVSDKDASVTDTQVVSWMSLPAPRVDCGSGGLGLGTVPRVSTLDISPRIHFQAKTCSSDKELLIPFMLLGGGVLWQISQIVYKHARICQGYS